jgi:hypothetical protein
MQWLRKILGRSRPVAPETVTRMRARGDDIQSSEEKANVRSHMEEQMDAARTLRNNPGEPPAPGPVEK